MWILVSVKDEVVMKFQSINLKMAELKNCSFEVRMSKITCYSFYKVPINRSHHSQSFMMSLVLR